MRTTAATGGGHRAPALPTTPPGATLASTGFATLPDLVAPPRMKALRVGVDHILETDRLADARRREGNVLVPLCWSDPAVETVLGDEASMDRLAHETNGRDLRWISGYISVRPPRTEALAWHQDWWCWDHPISRQPAAPQVTLVVYLDDVDASNAATSFVPESHALAARGALRFDDDGLLLDPPESTVIVSATAGDAVALDYRVVHGTTANDSDEPRHAVLLNFSPNWSSLPTEIRGHLISHPALPRETDTTTHSPTHPYLPTHGGARHDLALRRQGPPGAT